LLESVARMTRAPAAWPALVPAVAVPVLFLHLRYQPKVEVGLGSTTVGIELSDVAVLTVVVAALLAGLTRGWEPLRAGRPLWLLAAVFLGLIVVATVHPLLWQDDYRFLTHLVTAAKFCEYGLLAPALPLLLRRAEDALPLLWAIAVWSAAASGWGLLQFAGVVSELEGGRRPLQREPSFVGIHDFAALSGAALAVALATLALGSGSSRERALGIIAGVGGGIGLVLSGAVAGALGLWLAAAAMLGISRRRGWLTTGRSAAVITACVIVAVTVPLIRGGEVKRLFQDLGLSAEPKTEKRVESSVHRSMLAYIGLRIFLDHPVVGVGWQGSEELENYGPYLDDARRRFPDAPAVAFPSPEHAWGTQNAYLQALADLGLVGLLLLLVLVVVGVTLGVRAALRAPPKISLPAITGTLWLLVAAGVWNGLGLVAGIPLDALTWLGFGLVGAALAWLDDVRAG
jgi:O-antigen ligase